MGFSLSGAAKGALTGAAVGSAFPGVGTGFGALAGGILGGFGGGGGGTNQAAIDAAGAASDRALAFAEQMYGDFQQFFGPESDIGKNVRSLILSPEQIQEESARAGTRAGAGAEARLGIAKRQLERSQLEAGLGDPSSGTAQSLKIRGETAGALGVASAKDIATRGTKAGLEGRNLSAGLGLIQASRPFGAVASLTGQAVAGRSAIAAAEAGKTEKGLFDDIGLSFGLGQTGGLIPEVENFDPETPAGDVPADRKPMLLEPGEFLFSANEVKLLGLDFMLKGRKKAQKVDAELNIAGDEASSELINQPQQAG